MMRIAVCGGQELYEDGPRLYFVDRGTSIVSTMMFVAALFTLIPLGNGVAQLAMGNVIAGAVLCGVGALCGAGLWALAGARRKSAARPVADFIQLVLDRQAGLVTDRDGRPLAPLQGVMFRRAFQATSSSRALEICYGGQSVAVARGNPFAGSIEGFAEALRTRGFHVS